MFDPRHSVAGVLAKPSHKRPYEGTAFLVQGGLLVTCSHVLCGARRDDAQNVLVHFYGTPAAIPAQVLLDHPDHDLAVLKPHEIPEGIVALPLAPSEAARTHPFEAIGYPQKAGFPALYAQGSIYGLIHDLRGHAFLQLTSLEITHGYSGGPVLDQTLNAVVGIVSNGIPRDQLPEDALRNASFAIATETLQFLYPEFQFAPLPPPQVAGWLRPTAPPLHNMIRREAELHAVRELLQPGVITVIQGPPCVGKTVLAHQLAIDLDPLFPGGVIFQNNLGSEFRSPELCGPILKEWSSFDEAERGRDPNASVTPAEVRALFARQQPLLVVLDDVWNLDAVQPLRDALPQNACLLVTTRSQKTARELHGGIYSLDVLSPEDAAALLRSRLPAAEENAVPLLIDLAEGLGRQALAINIACGSLLRLRKDRWPAAIQKMIRQVTDGTGFGEIQLPDEYPDPRVASALFTSYQDLKPESQRRFRLLGAFAPDGLFSAQAAAGIWSCSPEEAEDQLTLFVERSLLTQHNDRLWRQHALLRAYGLALLRQAGEEESARQSHAQTYSQLMRAADDRQEHYRLLDEYLQLKHAFEWSIENNLDLSQDLIANTNHLQAAFNLVRESHDWAATLLSAAQTDRDPSRIARAQGNLANAFFHMAVLPNEDRRARLLEALDAYTQPLHHFRASAPLAYAMTQNNRGTVLADLAALQGEDRRARLLEALDAYTHALIFHRPEISPLDHAMTQSNRGTVLFDLAALPGENRHARLLETLDAYDISLQFRRPEVAPLAYAATQNNRGTVLTNLANSPDEDRRVRLLEAFEAFNQALRFLRPDTAPLDYAMTQNNRGNLLAELAKLPNEDSHTRMLEALDAYTQALLYYRPDTAPLSYALTQNNRGTVLRDLAASPNEKPRVRLLEALDAYTQALLYFRPDTNPLDYAMTQNNRGILLSSLAALPDEDRRAHLLEALDAYAQALRFRRPDTVPLDYAMTQNNRGNMLRNLATLPDEDTHARLLEALNAYDEALHYYRADTAPLAYAKTQDNRGAVLFDLAALPDEDRRARLFETLDSFTQALQFQSPEISPLDYAMTKANMALLLMDIAELPEEDQIEHYKKAMTSTSVALSTFLEIGHEPYAQQAINQFRWISEQIGASLFLELWQELGLGEIPDGLKDSE